MPSASPPYKFAAILLAAGLSKRFGAANKLLTDWHGKPLIAHAFTPLISTDLEEIIIVTGHEHAELQKTLIPFLPLHLKCRFIFNSNYQSGMGSSIATGARALSADISAAFIALADMPTLDAATFKKLIQEFQNHPPSTILAPTYKGQRGHPVLFGNTHFKDLQKLRGDKGAKETIENNRHTYKEIEMETESILKDIDRPEI